MNKLNRSDQSIVSSRSNRSEANAASQVNNHHSVIFEKPELKALSQNHTIVDIHFHSNFSDGISTVPQIIARAKKLNIGIGITDHNCIQGALEVDKHKEILSIPGIEVTAKEGVHILFYFYEVSEIKKFYNTHIKPNMGNDLMSPINLHVEELLDIGKKYECVMFGPHAYIPFVGISALPILKHKLPTILEGLHGLEAINGENTHKLNLKATVQAFNHRMPMIAGSDGHTLFHMGKAVTVVEGKVSRRKFLEKIKSGECRCIGKEIDVLRKVTSNSFKLRKTLKNYPEVIERSIRNSYKSVGSLVKSIRKKGLLFFK